MNDKLIAEQITLISKVSDTIHMSCIRSMVMILRNLSPHLHLAALSGCAAGLALALGEVERKIELGYGDLQHADGKSVFEHLTEDRNQYLSMGRALHAEREEQTHSNKTW